MSSSSLRRAPSVQLVLPSPVAGSVRVICPPVRPKTKLHTPRKRKINEISTITPLETSTMATSSSSHSVSSSSKHPALSLPPLDIPQYRPQFASTPIDSDSRCDGPPSPAATEIVDIESEDFTRTARQYGVKVRDFAYESKSATLSPASVKEYWDPLVSLLKHDVHIRRLYGSLGSERVTGKDLCRLLESGWVEEAEATKHWKPEDWEKMREYRDRPGGPFPYVIRQNRRKPVARLRMKLRREKYPCLPFDTPDDKIYVPKDEPGMWTGDDFKELMIGDGDHDDREVIAKRRRIVDEEASESAPITPLICETSSMVNPPHSQASSSTITSTNQSASTSSRTSASSRPRRNLKRTQTLVRVQ